MASVASIQYMRIPNTTTTSTSNGNGNGNGNGRFMVSVRSAQSDGPLRRPSIATPPVRPPTPTTPTPTPTPTQPSSSSSSSSVAVVVTMEYQRQKAKELQDYFKQKKLEEANQGPFFGFIPKNEISNGRWAMFGFAVGMLTEYATGSDFVDQVKILLSNFGILDLE